LERRGTRVSAANVQKCVVWREGGLPKENHRYGEYVGITAIGGVLFACGLPGWVPVRAFFRYSEFNKNVESSS
jgi:hypothetical protein